MSVLIVAGGLTLFGSAFGSSTARADPTCGKIGSQLERTLHGTTTPFAQLISDFQRLSRLNSLHAVCQELP